MEIERLVRDECRTARNALESAIREPPIPASQDGDVAQRALVRARDALIRQLRQSGKAPEAGQWRADLARLNGIISLVVGVEYPMGGLPRQLADEAIAALREMTGEPEAVKGDGRQAAAEALRRSV